MEVHHHAHHGGKKNWKSYFWEFLMLFLAVTLGFFVENQREHLIEHKREKQYMKSVVKDLEQDLTNIHATIGEVQMAIKRSDSLFQLLSGGDISSHNTLIYYFGRYETFTTFFYPASTTLQQLKTAGGFRLIRNRNVVDSLQDYDNLCQQISDRRNVALEEVQNFKEVVPRIFDVRVFNQMIDDDGDINMPTNNPQLIGTDKIDINNLLIQSHYSRRSKIGQINFLRSLEQKAKNLIALVKKEYHIS